MDASYMPIRTPLAGAALFLWVGNLAFAQLASWDVNGADASVTNPLAATVLSTDIASATLALGSGVTASASNDTFGGSAFNSTSLDSAVLNADYLSFTITPSAGFKLSISSISFNTGVATAVTNFNASLLSSSTGFTSSDSLYSYSFSTTTPAAQSVTLSGIPALQNVANSIEFRLYGYRDSAGMSTYRIRNLSGSDLIINGTVTAIPESPTYSLLGGISVLGLTSLRRFRNRNASSADGDDVR